ncbi:hypothetical protein [Curtobacterium sp. VKM Ac-2887]|uniref:hypothetical protein n=1 Tax=Curtobacterium sp. VKM Ac-2887 TaxID=2783819 RepID=UPI00188B99BF|nr:hypothetical protein [Curtobacterium sp. VKM Ac-2887]MBF4587977.1 hypothetical protein [Curtobacterium sp. VKM Ac-2887]
MTDATARKQLRHRLAMLAVTLDGDQRPPRSRLVWSLVEHGGQPLNPDLRPYETAVEDVDPQTLAAIADLYGVPRPYLTDFGADPVSEHVIDEDLFRIRTTTPRNRSAVTYETVSRVPVPQPAPEEVAVLSEAGRREARADVRSRIPALVLITIVSAIAVTALALVGTVITWILCGVAVLLFGGRIIGDVRSMRHAAAFARIPEPAFTVALQDGLRHAIARRFHRQRTHSRLPLEQLVAILDSTTPIGTLQLGALTGGTAGAQRDLLRIAVAEAIAARERAALWAHARRPQAR